MPNLRNRCGCSSGYCTISRSSRLTFSSPPMSSHDTFGTSTAVSRSADGFDASIAKLKCSWVTHMDASTSASMFSSSRSMTLIFSRMHWSAASVHSCARSAPTWPCVFFATTSRSTSSASFMFFV
eukprot:Amastigsp_a1520_219.p5 type:complete len:125 gc:universal Amastigsp_a1520_219:1561-1187(-)